MYSFRKFPEMYL